VQADRDLYKRFMLERLRSLPHLTIHEAAAHDVLLAGEQHAADAHAAAGSAVREIGAFRAVEKPSGHAPAARAPEIIGVVTDSGAVIHARKVVITTGTFLRGMVHIGPLKYPAGRHKRDSEGVWACGGAGCVCPYTGRTHAAS
jgi:tRNA U34 5-carboxymethylaminomethyl modifying enzyme MnmG/GidA